MRIGRSAVAFVACALGLLIVTPIAPADINLDWRPLQQTVYVGDPIDIGIYAVSDNTESQPFSSAQAILAWDPDYLLLTGSYDDLWTSGFIAGDSFGLNEASPPADGNGLWLGLVFLGQTIDANPEGTLLTTMTFNTLQETPETLVDILASAQQPSCPVCYSKVISGTQNIIGTIGGPAGVEIIPEPTSLGLLALGLVTLWRRR